MKDELEFRQLTLADEIWIQDSFPKYSEQMTTESIDKNVLTSILYKVLVKREAFQSIKVEEIDESGELKTVSIGGLELFRSKIVSEGDIVALMTAFIEVCDKSRPPGEELVKKKIWLRRSILWPLLTVFAVAIIGAITRLCL